ncbi:MAG: hypothetical protein ACOX4M_07085 [Acetivibrionales bacterium]|jgi:hypothetical protein
MKQTGFSNKYIIIVLGLITGITLFLASFSLLLINTVFNEEFHMEAAENLGFFDNISSILESIAGSVHDGNEQSEVVSENGITPDLVKSNFRSLISGLAGFVDMNDFLAILDRAWFILLASGMFSLITFTSVLALMLFKSPAEIRVWIRTSAASYALIYPVVTGLLGLFLHYAVSSGGMEKLQGILAVSKLTLEKSITGYISYFTRFLQIQALISAMVLFFGVEAVISRVFPWKPYDLALFGSSFRKPLISRSFVLLLTLLFLSITVNVQLISVKRPFISMGIPGTTVFAVQNTGSVSVTDAKDHEVCFLNVIILDESGNTHTTCQDLALYAEGSGTRIENTCTDTEESAAFLLEKGRYRIVLCPVSAGSIAFDFELSNAGRTDLFITIGKTKNGTAYIKDTSIRSMP